MHSVRRPEAIGGIGKTPLSRDSFALPSVCQKAEKAIWTTGKWRDNQYSNQGIGLKPARGAFMVRWT
jgi:hypothetical protein